MYCLYSSKESYLLSLGQNASNVDCVVLRVLATPALSYLSISRRSCCPRERRQCCWPNDLFIEQSKVQVKLIEILKHVNEITSSVGLLYNWWGLLLGSSPVSYGSN